MYTNRTIIDLVVDAIIIMSTAANIVNINNATTPVSPRAVTTLPIVL